MKLNPKQFDAVKLIASSFDAPSISIITGGPGTGKTTVLRWALSTLVSEDRQGVLLLAPTGKAALRIQEVTGVEAMTIHRYLFSGEAKTPTVCIVDESSMVDAELLAALMRRLPSTSSLVLIGDADQLPSVGPGRVFGDLIQSGSIRTVRLTEVHRAMERSWVCQNAPVILNGDIDLMPTSDFVFIDAKGEDDVISAVTKVWRKESTNTAKSFQLLIPMRRFGLGTEKINAHLQTTRLSTEEALRADPERNALPSGPFTSFWRGDPVIHVKNNYGLGVFNGETGTITSIRSEKSAASTGLSVVYGKRVVDYNPAVAQDELRLAYAMTIHKSQGSEWDSVAVVCHDAHRSMWNKQLLYTAVTRSRGMVYLIGTESAVRRAIATDAPSTRITTLQQRLR